jgi:hypothetical protein
MGVYNSTFNNVVGFYICLLNQSMTNIMIIDMKTRTLQNTKGLETQMNTRIPHNKLQKQNKQKI